MVSDTMPKAGRIMMYTSGCPKIQNRCSQSSGSAPADTSKKLASKSRSQVSRNRATESTGMAKSMRDCVNSDIQVNMGNIISVSGSAKSREKSGQIGKFSEVGG